MQQLKEFLAFPFKIILLLRFKKLIKNANNKNIFLVDIDNTLADSWHSLKLRIWKNENDRLQYLAVFIGMKTYIQQLMANENNHVIFFTARSLFSRKVTMQWLNNVGFTINHNQLVITRNAAWKVDFINSLELNKCNITYIDDLSHKHEKGKVEFFENEIKSIDDLQKKFSNNFKYINAKEINVINGL